MTSRELLGLGAGPGTTSSWLRHLEAALGGSGPALLPLPVGPPVARANLIAVLRPGVAAAPIEADDVALVVPTSGSEGTPKGALLTSAALRASAEATNERLGGPGRWVLALPHTHIAGLMVLIRSLVAGTEPVELPLSVGFDAAAFDAATRAAAGAAGGSPIPLYTALVPTQLVRLLDAGCDLTRYDAVLVGAAAVPGALLDRARSAGVRVVTTYGMTETCGGCVYDGVALDGTSVEIAPDGRVLLGGLTLFSGYRLDPARTAHAMSASGAFVTGDLGRTDPAGLLHILGRADDVIVTGGEKVVPRTVEQALEALLGIAGCVVVGVPDKQWGERVVAVIELDPERQSGGEPGGRSVAPDDLTSHVRRELRQALPAAWLPKHVVAVPIIPLLPTGKPDRAAVRILAGIQDPDG
jgi:o-succinylbenzoate---CoA ligase